MGFVSMYVIAGMIPRASEVDSFNGKPEATATPTPTPSETAEIVSLVGVSLFRLRVASATFCGSDASSGVEGLPDQVRVLGGITFSRLLNHPGFEDQAAPTGIALGSARSAANKVRIRFVFTTNAVISC